MTATKGLVSLDDAREVTRLLDAVDYVLTDCDGVIYLNNTVIPGTPGVFAKLRSLGKKVLFVSNNSSKSRKAVLKKLNDMGFQAKLEEVFVSSYVVAEYFKSHNFAGKVWPSPAAVSSAFLPEGSRCTSWDVRGSRTSWMA